MELKERSRGLSFPTLLQTLNTTAGRQMLKGVNDGHKKRSLHGNGDSTMDAMCEKYPQLRLGISSYNLLKNEVFGFLLM